MKKSKSQNVKRLPIVFPIDLHKFAETATGEAPKEIHVLPTGRWNHPAYGPIVITTDDIREFKDNFDKGLRKGIPITEGHEVMDEKPAVGWFKELIDRGANGLYAVVEWTETGKTLLSEKAYKYFSPEFYSEYEDPETREIHTNVLVGGALTNKPYFKELEAVVMSESSIKNQFNETKTMNLQEVLAKKVEELSDDEKAFLRDNKEQLTDDQLSTFGSVFEDTKDGEGEGEGEGEGNGEGEGTKDGEGAGEGEGDGSGEGEGDGAGDGEGAGEGEGEGSGDGEGEGAGKVEASEGVEIKDGKVMMSTAAFKALSSKANAGYAASEKLRKAEIASEASKLVFSEQNSKGKVLPKNESKLVTFMEGLTAKQRKTFAEIIEAIPAGKLFSEQGHGAAVEGSAFAEVENRAKKLMSENNGLGYADAVSRVFSEDKELATRYEQEIA